MVALARGEAAQWQRASVPSRKGVEGAVDITLSVRPKDRRPQLHLNASARASSGARDRAAAEGAIPC